MRINNKTRVRVSFGWILTVWALSTSLSDRSSLASDLKPELRERVRRASVLVFTSRSENSRGDTPVGSGSGYFINNNGLMITNNHVVDPSHDKPDFQRVGEEAAQGLLIYRVAVNAGTNDEKIYEAKDLYRNQAADLALLQVYESEGVMLKTPDYLRFPPGERLRRDMPVWTIGWPGGERQRTENDQRPAPEISFGNVSDIRQSAGGRILKILSTAQVRPGNSGGPCIDEDGFLVGTVTLLQGSEKEGEVNSGTTFSGLSPARLAAQMVRAAHRLRKMPARTDVTPFMELLTDADGRVNIPEYTRKPEHDALYFSDATLHGAISTDHITWNSALGEHKIPISACAYMMHGPEGSQLFLEGGNRIGGTKSGQKFKFTMQGGEPTEYSFDDVEVIAFRTSKEKFAPIPEKLLVLDADITRLILADVQGTVKFEVKNSKLDVALADIFRLERRQDGLVELVHRSGQNWPGKFTDGTYRAKICPTNLELPLKIAGVSRGYVSPAVRRAGALAGLDLGEILTGADTDVQQIVADLEEGDNASARAKIDAAYKGDAKRRLSEIRQEQFAVLHAYCLLREGKYAEAKKGFAGKRDAKKDANLNLAWFATACDEVLKKLPDGQFQGKPLQDPIVFTQAGNALVEERSAKLESWLKDAADWGSNKGDFKRAMPQCDQFEKSIKELAVFQGPEADDDLVRLWRACQGISVRELRRIFKLPNVQLSEDQQGRSMLSASDQEILKQIENAMESFLDYYARPSAYGFILYDPNDEG